MSFTSRGIVPLLVCVGVAACIAGAPGAAADRGVLPQPGSESASDTIKDLKAQGYDVQINWVNGYPNVSLSQCWVNTINTADASGTLPTVFIDVECPH
jgi:ABC-type glycerol-3-phosphate transport system substrate-binding protein